MLMLCVASCATQGPRVKFVAPDVPPPAVVESAAVDKNDRTGEPGVWMNIRDGKLLLKERIILRSIIDQYRAYLGKTQ